MAKKNILSKIQIVFVLGILLHLLIMPFTFHGDMTNYNGWGKYILEHDPSSIYNFSFRGQLLSDANYQPLMLWLCSLVSVITRLLKDMSWQLNVLIPVFPSKLVFFFEGELPYIYVFKLLLILADFGLAYLAYLFVKRQMPKSDSAPIMAAALIMFNPAIIFGTTIWGQIDILPIVFIMSGLYLMFYKKQTAVSAVLMVVALLLKQTTIIFLPVYFLAVFKFFGRKEFLKSVAIMAVGVWAGYAPFVNQWANILSPFTVYIQKVQLASDNTFTTKSAWNFWVLFHNLDLVNDHQKILGISYNLLGYVLVLITLIAILFRNWQKKEKTVDSKVTSTLQAYFLIAMASFIFLTRLHERHLLQAIPFLILLFNNKKMYYLQLMYLSLFIVVNLFFVWHPISYIINVDTTKLVLIKLAVIVLLVIFYYQLGSVFLFRKEPKD